MFAAGWIFRLSSLPRYMARTATFDELFRLPMAGDARGRSVHRLFSEAAEPLIQWILDWKYDESSKRQIYVAVWLCRSD